jgi:4-diphosphocytidyl-2-C-methyl-D-erythritol kinase
MSSITVKAYAKINLGLDVIRKREDGYHDVCMIMQSLELHDTIIINKSSTNEIAISTNLSYLPVDKGNLVYKAAALFFENISSRDGVTIKLNKKIPVAAGLAGGSSDAAATLKGLNSLYQAGLSMEQLMKLGVKIGADVPYCIMLGTALSEGIGEVLTPLSPIPDCFILLVKPNISVSTKYVYENLKLNTSVMHPDIAAMKKALSEGNLSALTGKMDNILQTVTVKDYPVIADIKKKMLEFGAASSLMSGSGPTVFGIYKSIASVERAASYFRKHPEYGRQVFVTKPDWP